LAWEDEVRFSKHSLIPPPAGDAVFAKQFRQCKLGLLVAASANPFRLGTDG
jgi:hypothetical protein